MPSEELAQVIFVDVAVVAHINKIESLVRRELRLLLSEDSKLLSLDLILKMSGPGLQEQLSSLRVEDLLLWHQRLGIHRQRRFFCKQACMEGVLRKESLAEL